MDPNLIGQDGLPHQVTFRGSVVITRGRVLSPCALPHLLGMQQADAHLNRAVAGEGETALLPPHRMGCDMPISYEDFDVRIWREGDRYVAEVLKSPAGGSEREILSWPFDCIREPILLRLENAVLKSRNSRRGLILSPEEKVLRDFGADVFRSVFRESRTVADAYRDSLAHVRKQENVGLRINLRVDPPELASLPWEYAFDPGNKYLCLHTRSPVVRRLAGASLDRPIKVRDQVRVLAMMVDLGGQWALPDAERERRQLNTIMEAPGLNVDLKWNLRSTKDSLLALMQQGPWDIFHFIGHGGTSFADDADGNRHSEGYVVMDDGLGTPDPVGADELASILEDGNVSLAVMNCCESGRGSGSSSIGATLVHAGIPMAIAMQFAITDVSAARFSRMFYESLAQGQTVEQALTVARKSVWGETDAEWAIPVLFSQTNAFPLFKANRPQASPGAAAPPPPAPAQTAADAVRDQAQQELRRLWCQS